MLDLNKIYNMDCMDGMAQFPDKYFDLAIVDPPYGLGDRLVDGAGKDVMAKYKKSYKQKKWDEKPSQSYFEELFRVSKNQIIWGGNYFNLPPTRGIVCWDKKQFMMTFSRWEYAWTSYDSPSKMFEYLSQDSDRFHPTQKPVALYTWLLNNYAKQGYKILDTHLGSASSIIACLQSPLELQYIGFEIDKEYFDLASKRIADYQAQMTIFEVMK